MTKLFPTAVIGSMPRPQYIQDILNPAIKKKETLYQNNLNEAITFIAQQQEYTGLDIVSDGEWRRLSYIGVIADLLNGFEVVSKDGIWWHTVTEKLSYKQKGLFAKEAKFLLKHVSSDVKVALPSPYLIGSRMWNEKASKKVYPTRESFMWALVPYLRKEIIALAKIGVSVVQIDDPNLCLFVDPDYRKRFADPQKECELAVTLVNGVIDEISGIEIAIHLCRSSGTRNRQLSKKTSKGFVGEGSFDYILPHLNQLNVDQYAMEFAVPGGGDYSVLSALPKKAKIGFGCVDCRSNVFDTAETIVQRVEKAMEYVDNKRIILNPDCGFAPGIQAPVQLDQAYLKLKEMNKAATLLRAKYK
jgi:5-methyltetrahydropteroyltriglutamate--homocysteine methyltransferase